MNSGCQFETVKSISETLPNFGLFRIMQVVPLIRELIAETEGPVGAQIGTQGLDDLLTIIKTIKRRVLDSDQHIGNRSVVELVGRFGHPELPGSIHIVPLEREQHFR